MPIPVIEPAVESAQQEAASQPERYFLEGPHSRKTEFWMLLRIIKEFMRASTIIFRKSIMG